MLVGIPGQNKIYKIFLQCNSDFWVKVRGDSVGVIGVSQVLSMDCRGNAENVVVCLVSVRFGNADGLARDEILFDGKVTALLRSGVRQGAVVNWWVDIVDNLLLNGSRRRGEIDINPIIEVIVCLDSLIA